RRRLLLILGLATTAAFFVVRGINVYGDPHPWEPQDTWGQGAMAFLNCTKYPPSLCYLLMTLGPALLMLWALDGALDGGLGGLPIGRALETFGRVPMFFYILHLYLLHGGAVLLAYLRYGATAFTWSPLNPPPREYWLQLPAVYLVAALALAVLYPLCAWFA